MRELHTIVAAYDELKRSKVRALQFLDFGLKFFERIFGNILTMRLGIIRFNYSLSLSFPFLFYFNFYLVIT